MWKSVGAVAAVALLGRSALASSSRSAVDVNALRLLGPQGVNLWRLSNLSKSQSQPSSARLSLVVKDVQLPLSATGPSSEFPELYFEQPLDHFDNTTSETFFQRYWINTRHYTTGSGGPVIVLDGGETSGEDRIPFLDTGIVEILAKATGGVGVVLEHRYYGGSIPVANFSTDSLRFLNNAQAAADSANFMANVRFPGIEEDLTAPQTAWIYYGGSYAGARAAHMKVLYPDLVYGAIASSGVTHASIMNWEYFDVIRRAADPKCSGHLERSIQTIDWFLEQPRLKKYIKRLFGLEDLVHDEDFASVIEAPLGSWQAKVWDPAVGSPRWDEFCTAISKPLDGASEYIDSLPYAERGRAVKMFNSGVPAIDFTLLNYAKWIKENVVSRCPEGYTTEECFGTFDDTRFQEDGIDQEWRAWIFQVCTEWGYFATAPPELGIPRIVSKFITLEYESMICRQAFPPGIHFRVPHLPNVTAVNSLGNFDIAADRLAIIDGEVDPWRPDTPHSEYAADREDTILRPFKLIPNAVHHYDEYGLRNLDDEPQEIKKIHEEMIAFVLEWLKDRKTPDTHSEQ